MDKFWVASEQPLDEISVGQARKIVAWCEDEVERAVRESWSCISIIDGEIAPDGEIPVNALVSSPWDEAIGNVGTVSQLIEDAVGAFVGGGKIDRSDWANVDKALTRIECVVARLRGLYAPRSETA